jgi:hypothetical protein
MVLGGEGLPLALAARLGRAESSQGRGGVVESGRLVVVAVVAVVVGWGCGRRA